MTHLGNQPQFSMLRISFRDIYVITSCNVRLTTTDFDNGIIICIIQQNCALYGLYLVCKSCLNFFIFDFNIFTLTLLWFRDLPEHIPKVKIRSSNKQMKFALETGLSNLTEKNEREKLIVKSSLSF